MGGLPCLCPLSTFRGVCSLRFVLSRVCVAYSVFWLLSSVPPASCTCFAAPEGAFWCPLLLLCLSSPFSIAFPCHLGGLGLFLRLCCLSLVVVFCTPGFFFPLWVSLLFFCSLDSFASSLRLSSLLSFPSALLRFLLSCLILAPVCCFFSILRFLFFCCGWSPLQQFRVSGFPSGLFCTYCAFASIRWWWLIFIAFFLVSSWFCFCFEHLDSVYRRCFSVSQSFCFAGLSVITCSSPAVGFAIVLTCVFCLHGLFFLIVRLLRLMWESQAMKKLMKKQSLG